MATDEHGNKGNQNAKKDETVKSAANLHGRVLKSDKAKWVKQAQRSEDTKGLTEWIVKTLNAALDEDLKNYEHKE